MNLRPESIEALEARLRAIREAREARATAQAAWGSAPPIVTQRPPNSQPLSSPGSIDIDNELDEIQSMLSDNSSYMSRRQPLDRSLSASYATLPPNATRFDSHISSNSGNSPALWTDMRPITRSYLRDGDDSVPSSSTTVVAFHQRGGPASYPLSGTPSVPGSTNARGYVSYELAFRLIQQAAEAERGADTLLAIQLYADASELLVRVGNMEKDPILKHAVQEKANAIMKRAEELDQWCFSVQESSRTAQALPPPRRKIQMMSVPRVQESWHGRRPPHVLKEEFTHMRYTAVTTQDPDQFTDDGFQLRVGQADCKVRTFITITVDREGGSELQRTLTGIARNVQHMCELWGEYAWENVAVAVVSDGQTSTSSSCLEYLTRIGAFDEEIMAVTSAGVDAHMHLFESTIQLPNDDDFEAYYPPIQLIYALKQDNAGKLNSHLWFFNAFSEQLVPTYTVLLDGGTIPGPDAIFKLVRTMDRNPQIGGVTGEVEMEQSNYCNPVVAAQHFQYKYANIMDRSLESVCGYIRVLPCAFSAYRYEAIRAEKGMGPLSENFRSLAVSLTELGPFKGNMYLAHDHILNLELLVRKGRNWTVHYVKDAIAHTEGPDTLEDLIKQRRRSLNGSFFASLFAITNFGRIWTESGHSVPRKCVLSIQFVYLMVQNVLRWFLLGNVFLTCYYVLLLTLYTDVRGVLQAVLGIYSALIMSIAVFTLGTRPEKRTAVFYTFCFVFFGIVMLTVSSISIYGLVSNADLKDPRDDLPSCTVSDYELTAVVSTAIGLFVVSAFVHGEFSVLLSAIQYLFMLPTYVNILGTYAYSDVHELRWNTERLETRTISQGPAKPGKPGNLKEIVAQQKHIEAEKQRIAEEKEDVRSSFDAFRSMVLLSWLVTNAAWMFSMVNYMSSSCYLLGLSYVVACYNAVRFLGATLFVVLRIVSRISGPHGSSAEDSMYEQRHSPEWAAQGSPQVRVDVHSPVADYREQTL